MLPLPAAPDLRYDARMKLRLVASAFGAALFAQPAAAGPADCGDAVCLAPRETLGLAHVITFDDVRSALGIGHPIEGVLVRPGARFGERFAGQIVESEGDFDRVSGTPLAPLTVVPGAPGATLGAMRLGATTVLQGHGPRAFPRTEAVGEGAIAVAFDHDQAALAFDLRGGESGALIVTFLRRDGSQIARLRISPLREESLGFLRRGSIPDIAGILIENSDPQGVAIDNLAFDKDQLTG